MSHPPSNTRTRLNPSYWKHGYCVPLSEDVVPSMLFMKHKHFLVVDVETQRLTEEVGGWDHIDKLGISVACAYDSKTDKFLSYTEKNIRDLIDLCEERLVIGFNIRGFDLLVLEPYGLSIKKVDAFDIMYDLEALTRIPYLNLESIARGTLGTGKSADGKLAVKWWKEGLVQKIVEYCMQDVKITRDIFQFGRQNGFVKIQKGETPMQVGVNWN